MCFLSKLRNQMRAMSFNIRNAGAPDGINGWEYRKNIAASMIRFHQVDIAGLQEVLINQMDDLETLLPEYGFIGVGRDDGKMQGEFVPVLYLKERFEPVNKGAFWLSQTPEVPGSMGWDAACCRVTTWVEFTDKLDGKTFFFFNTHFDHMGAIAVKESSYLLQDMVENIAGKNPVIVTGDFNKTEDSEAYRIITGKEINQAASDKAFEDSRHISSHEHHGPNITFHNFNAAEYFYNMSKNGFEERAKNPADEFENIDYIFVKNNVQVLQHATLSDNWNGRYPSDHMPIVADLII